MLSQLLTYTAPTRQLADDELSAGEFDQEYFDRWAPWQPVLCVAYSKHTNGCDAAPRPALVSGHLGQPAWPALADTPARKGPAFHGAAATSGRRRQLTHARASRRKYEVLNLKIVHRRHCTGFEQNRELPLHIDDLIAGRYQVRGRALPDAFVSSAQGL